jgi:septal ring factor EnvC (AmiA/AmiB activator)
MEERDVRRNIIILSIAVAGAIAVIPTLGLASPLGTVVHTKHSAADSKRDAALFRQAFKKIRGLNTGLAVVRASLSTAKRDIAGLKTKVATAQGDIATLKTNVSGAQGDITTLKTNVGTAQSDISTLKSELAAGATALTQLSTAIQDPTTGLVGLNHARPQFGAFQSNGTIIAGTGQVSGASGPSTNATVGTGGFANFYVVDFGNDVSSRFLSVTDFPTGALPVSSSATDCAASAGASSLCQGVESAGSPDTSKNHVVVQFSGSPAGGFEVAAISG